MDSKGMMKEKFKESYLQDWNKKVSRTQLRYVLYCFLLSFGIFVLVLIQLLDSKSLLNHQYNHNHNHNEIHSSFSSNIHESDDQNILYISKSSSYIPLNDIIDRINMIPQIITSKLLLNTPNDLTKICPTKINIKNDELNQIQKNIINETRNKISQLLPTDKLILIPAAPRSSRPESDNEIEGWRQISNIIYLMGSYYSSDSILILNNKNNDLKIDVFISIPEEREMIFYGGIPDLKKISENYNVNAFQMNDIYNIYSDYFKKDGLIFETTAENLNYIHSLIGNDININLSNDISDIFRLSRFEKTKSEIILLEKASYISSWIHSQMDYHIRQDSNIDEARLLSEFRRLSGLCGALIQSYAPIIASGNHSAVLHYRTGQYLDSYDNIEKSKLILIDAASEIGGYASDLTRTYIRGETTKEILEIINAVQISHDKGIESIYNNVKWSEIQYESWSNLVIELQKIGLIYKELDLIDLMNIGAWVIFCPHGLGHPIGLDVHDLPIPKSVQLPKNEDANELTYSERISLNKFINDTLYHTYSDYTIDYHLKEGHLTTIEPGIYFIQEYLNSIKESLPKNYKDLKIQDIKDLIQLNNNELDSKSKLALIVNWELVNNYIDIGGVRIEDVILIEKNNIKILTEDYNDDNDNDNNDDIYI